MNRAARSSRFIVFGSSINRIENFWGKKKKEKKVMLGIERKRLPV